VEDTLFNYILIYIVLEVYEVQWQKANTLIGMLARMYEHYQKSAFIFLLMHPTLYFVIFFMLESDYNSYVVALFSIKSIDIATKMLLLKKVFMDKELSKEISMALMVPLNRVILYLGLVIYLPLIYMAFTHTI